MTALVRNTALPARDMTPALPVRPTYRNGGFALTRANPGPMGELGRVALTILLVLYPTLATVGLVLAAFMMTGTTV